MEDLQALRNRIRGLRRLNYENKAFIPRGILDHCLSIESITLVVRSCKVEPWREAEIIRDIDKGGRGILAVLMLIKEEPHIVKFCEHNNALDGTLDAKIPFVRSTLDTFVPAIADEFFERNGRLSPPSSCRNSRTSISMKTLGLSLIHI